MVPGATLKICDDVWIERDAVITSEGILIIGSGGFIGQGAVIVANERIDLGPDALIASYVTIRDHDHGTVPGRPYRLQALVTAAIKIGRNVWIGANAVILKGTTIGDNCVVGAGSVVTRSIEAGMIAAGVPARPIRSVALPETNI